MNEETRKALKKVVEYMTEAERANYNDAGQPANHIYTDVQKLDGWLGSQNEAGGGEHEVSL
jgi:hypothetical protein